MQENQDIGRRVKALIERSGLSQAEIAQKLKITAPSLSQMLSGRAAMPYQRYLAIANITAATDSERKAIEDLYCKKITKKALGTVVTREKLRAETSNAMFYTEPITQDKLFPVLGAAAAASVNTVAYPLAEYARDNAERMVFFPDGQLGDFVIEVSGNSMEPWYPDGTLLLVRGNVKIRRGERVVAIMEDGEVLFKIFADKGDKIALFSIDDKGKDFFFDRSNTYQIKGIYRVIASLRNEAQLDNAMEQAGVHHRWENKYNEME